MDTLAPGTAVVKHAPPLQTSIFTRTTTFSVALGFAGVGRVAVESTALKAAGDPPACIPSQDPMAIARTSRLTMLF